MPDRVVPALRSVCLVALLLLIVACDTSGRIINPFENPLESLAGDWTVTQIGGKDVAGMLPGNARVPTITVGSDGSINGFGGVNTFTSSLNVERLARGVIDMTPAAVTRMAGSPAAMEVEGRFFRALGETTGFSLDGDTLDFKRGDTPMLEMLRSGGN